MSLNTEHLQRCIETLEQSLHQLEASASGTVDYEVFRNAVVKGFELTLETSGKLLKKALAPYFVSSKESDRLTFKDIFRHGAKHDFLDARAAERWFQYRDNRNNTAHDYGRGFAEETLALVPSFLEDVKQLKRKIDDVDA